MDVRLRPAHLVKNQRTKRASNLAPTKKTKTVVKNLTAFHFIIDLTHLLLGKLALALKGQ